MDQKAAASKPTFPALEEQILAWWEKENIFKQTLEKTKDGKPFVFFEGPPTANGRPGIHHVLARAYKDIICRYKTMRGFYVERKAGWDTHGLPVELQVEKALGISGKPQIENIVTGNATESIKQFNTQCKESVWKYKAEWEQLTRRIGFWLDLEHPYVTYDNDYIESLWWIIKQVWDKQLLYHGHKVVPHCPRCGTALSSHEVAQGYADVVDTSVYVKFKLKDKENTYVLSWTTTPWTLPGNVALAVGKDMDYVTVEIDDAQYIVAEAALERLGGSPKVINKLKGAELVGLAYEPLFSIPLLKSETSYQLYAADFVNTEEGTGVVHTAVMYGEDDYRLGEQVGLPKHHTVNQDGTFTEAVPGLSGMFVKDDKTEQAILTYLEERGLLFRQEPYKHSYPFCWRCGTPLLYYAKASWFIRMSGLREELIKRNETVNWVPGYIKHGRFGEWLNEVKDWAFSRERYWGTPLPIWECEECRRQVCIASREELAKLATDPASVDDLDLHRPYVDSVALRCDKEHGGCGGTMRRVKEVVDVWFDSGAMPYAQWHYPFENKERVDEGTNFPADYISEAIDQTRGWFYTLLAEATLLGKPAPYKNVVCLGHILDDKGQKMSKSKGNVVDPFMVIEKYGADALRWHLFTMNQPGDVKLFDEKNVESVVKKQWLILWNVLSFWKLYRQEGKGEETAESVTHPLDQWITSRLHQLVMEVTNHLDKYEITEAGRKISDVIQELSTWYVRRSRERVKKEGPDREAVLGMLRQSLATIAKLLAPFTPLVADALYREVRTDGPESVHLVDWPEATVNAADNEALTTMATVRQAVEAGHSLRKEQNLKVRQPLAQYIIKHAALAPGYAAIIQAELNVKEVIFTDKLPAGKEFVTREQNGLAVALDTTITDELRQEGIVREIVRHLNAMRKDARLTINDQVSVYYDINDPNLAGIVGHYRADICRDVLAAHCLEGVPDNVEAKKVLTIGGATATFGMKKQ